MKDMNLINFTDAMNYAVRYLEPIINDMRKYPAEEQRMRDTFASILEDAAIEYQMSPILSDFLNQALSYRIRYFYITSSKIKSENAFQELVAALIDFGDIGVLKGTFHYDEAMETFRKIDPLMLKGIKEPDLKKRYAISQEMFEIARPLWEGTKED